MCVSNMSSLEELCFNCICRHFSVYTAIASTEDARLKKGLHFLRRVYSQALLDRLGYIRELDEDGIEFLLNEYLKKLDLVLLLENCRKERIIENVCKLASNVTELSCVVDKKSIEYRLGLLTPLSSVSSEDCLYTLNALLPYCNYITNICLPDICNDATLMNIASFCPHLTQLNICHSENITRVGIEVLCRCPLEKLNLIQSSASFEDVEFLLTHIPTLQKLKFECQPWAIYYNYKSSLKNKMLNKSINTYNLTSLIHYGHDSTLAETMLLCAEICPYIRELRLSVYDVNDLLLCSRFQSLDRLYIRGRFDFINAEYFLREYGERLKHFSADTLKLSISTLITSCPNLESVRIMECDCLPPNENNVGILNYLHSLEFQLDYTESDYTNSLELLLNSSPMLEKLTLEYFDFSNSDLVTMLDKYLKNSGIKYLSFRSSEEIELDKLARIVLSSKTLQSLTIFGSGQYCSSDLQTLYQNIKASNREIEIENYSLNKVRVYTKEFPFGLIPYISTWSPDYFKRFNNSPSSESDRYDNEN